MRFTNNSDEGISGTSRNVLSNPEGIDCKDLSYLKLGIPGSPFMFNIKSRCIQESPTSISFNMPGNWPAHSIQTFKLEIKFWPHASGNYTFSFNAP